MNENMDKMAHWTYFIFTRLTFPIFVLSNLLLTAANYFILDMGNESYFLPSPILYVQFRMGQCYYQGIKEIFNTLSPFSDCQLIGRLHLDT